MEGIMKSIHIAYSPICIRRFCAFFAFALALAASAMAEDGITKDQILLGQTTALSGPLADLGKETSSGANAYFSYINSQGGINGREIKLITLDDGYNTQRGVENVKQLIKNEKVFALFNNISTPMNLAIMPIIEKYGVPNFAPYTGSEAIRMPFNRLVFHVRAGYKDEIESIIRHLDIRGLDRLAVIYQNNAFGKGGLGNVTQAVPKTAVKVVSSMPIESDGSDVEKAAHAIYPSKPNVILLITAGKSTLDFVKAYNKLSPGVQYSMLSVMGTQETVQALGNARFGTIVSQVMPFPFSGTTSIVMKYQSIMKKLGIKEYSFASMEGFVSAVAIVEGLKRAGKHPTRQSFITALESMHDYNLGDFYLDYSPTRHLGSRFVDLTVMTKDGRFVR
jgi:ABC-type branched-subunit amino acid transport system substrate-binding protein